MRLGVAAAVLLAVPLTLAAQAPVDAAAWRRGAVCYEIFVRSFQDSNGDGKLTQFSDYRPRVGEADLRPGAHPPDAGRDSDVPVDHLSAVHPSTVRAPGDDTWPRGLLARDSGGRRGLMNASRSRPAPWR